MTPKRSLWPTQRGAAMYAWGLISGIAATLFGVIFATEAPWHVVGLAGYVGVLFLWMYLRDVRRDAGRSR